MSTKDIKGDSLKRSKKYYQHILKFDLYSENNAWQRVNPHVKASKLYDAFGVKPSTGQTKSKQVRNILKMKQFDQNWTLPSRMERNPKVWMISLNGFIVDVRNQPKEIQEIAFEKGLIPCIPDS